MDRNQSLSGCSMDTSEQPEKDFGSSRRPFLIRIGLVLATIAYFVVWKFCVIGVDFWRWQSLVFVIGAVCLVIAFTVLLQRLASQLRRLEQSQEELRRAKEEVEQARTLAEETNRQHLEAQRIGKIGHWYTDEATQSTTWSPQMFKIIGIQPKPVLSTHTTPPSVHPANIPDFLAPP